MPPDINAIVIDINRDVPDNGNMLKPRIGFKLVPLTKKQILNKFNPIYIGIVLRENLFKASGLRFLSDGGHSFQQRPPYTDLMTENKAKSSNQSF